MADKQQITCKGVAGAVRGLRADSTLFDEGKTGFIYKNNVVILPCTKLPWN